MMADRKAGNITLWLNVHKEADTKQPDYRGKCAIDGKEYDIAMWHDKTVANVAVKLSGQITKEIG